MLRSPSCPRESQNGRRRSCLALKKRLVSKLYAMPTSYCQPIRLLDPVSRYIFTYFMTNSADPDLDLHCLQRQGISRFSRTRVNYFGVVKVIVVSSTASSHPRGEGEGEYWFPVCIGISVTLVRQAQYLESIY